jgi:hypothetical protein
VVRGHDHRRTAVIVALVVASGLILLACGSSKDSPTTAGTGAGSVVPALTSGGRSVPDPLDQLEAQSEDIIDIVPGGKWDDVAEDVATVDRAWKGYEPQAAADGAPAAIVSNMGAAVAALDAASQGRQATETMQAANDLSAGVVELYGLYDIGRPVGIGRLDVIGRQIVFDAAAKDQAKVEDQVAAATREVAAIEPDLRAHDGAKVIDQAHAELAAMTAAAASADFATVTAQAKDFLETVDAMEQLY